MNRKTWTVLMLALGCTDASLYYPELEPPAKPDVRPNRLVGSFCTEDPATVVFPLKVWMVIDDSGSMQQSDPNQRRYSGVQELATHLASPGHVFFGGEVFTDTTQGTRRFSQPRFLDDVNQFNQQVAAVASPGNGHTPYLGALNLALAEISTDILENKATAKRTRYVVIFLSDGQPTDSMEPDILSATDALMALASQVGGLTLNTVFLGGGDAIAELILQNMATHGGGEYKSFANGDELDYSGFDFSAIRRSYVQRLFLATNRSMLATGKVPAVDSDQDGISDEEELRLGTNPTSRDTDGDGCNDAMERRVGWDPVVPGNVNHQCNCMAGEGTRDTDLDGLSDCDERWIGTLPLDPDSDLARGAGVDGDLVPDGLDFYAIEDPTIPNLATDRDLDGVLDLEELKNHSSVTDLDIDRERWAYRYEKYDRQGPDSRCYDFVIANITLGHTQATAEHQADENVVELYLSQSSQDDPYKDRIYRMATLKVPFSEGGRDIRVAPTDFSTILAAPKQ